MGVLYRPLDKEIIQVVLTNRRKKENMTIIPLIFLIFLSGDVSGSAVPQCRGVHGDIKCQDGDCCDKDYPICCHDGEGCCPCNQPYCCSKTYRSGQRRFYCSNKKGCNTRPTISRNPLILFGVN